MQFSTVAIISAFAAVVAANGNHTASPVWVTDTVTALTTVCPEATSFSFNGVTYTATESETITITNCPCTVSKPVYTTSSVICETCTAVPTTAPAPVYPNGTVPATTVATSAGSVGTSSAIVSGTASPSSTAPIVSNSGNRVLAFSGASLAGLLGVAAYIL